MTTFQAMTRGYSARAAVPASPAARANGGGAGGATARAPGERVVGHRGEALLIRAERQQQVRDAVGRGRSRSVVPTQKQCTRRPPGATSSAPLSATSQTPRLARSTARPVARWRSLSLVVEQVAEQALGHALRLALPHALRAEHVRAPEGVELGDDPRVHEGHEGHRGRQRLERSSTPAARKNGTM